MEERNLELDDDGKIKLRKRNEGDVAVDLPEEDDDGIVLDVPDLKGFEEEKEEDDERLVQGSDAWEAELRRRKAESEKVFGEGEALFAAGDYDGAGEKYLDSAALYGANWRPWFGVVRVQTKDFTDFAGIYDCENAYDRAFKRMPKAEREALAEKYVPSLTVRAEECGRAREKFTAEDVQQREGARESIERAYVGARKVLIIAVAVFAVFLAAGCILAPFVNAVPDVRFLVPCIVCFALAVASAAYLAVVLRRFVSARKSLTRNRRAGTTAAGEQARIYAEEEELIRSIIEDFTK